MLPGNKVVPWGTREQRVIRVPGSRGLPLGIRERRVTGGNRELPGLPGNRGILGVPERVTKA